MYVYVTGRAMYLLTALGSYVYLLTAMATIKVTFFLNLLDY